MRKASIREKIEGRMKRYLAENLYKRRRVMRSSTPLISFTFDDFPRSSLSIGGAILRAHGIRGSFYACFSLLGKRTKLGDMFNQADIEYLLSQGHELGCHTADHLHPWVTPPALFEKSVLVNMQRLKDMIPGIVLRSFSYPLAYPKPQVKRKIAEYFECCRCGGQKNNTGVVDLNLLNAYFLEFSTGNADPVIELIELNKQVNGWLIFATHDISEQPSQHGCTPAFFKQIVGYSMASGARIVPVIEAYENIFASEPAIRLSVT